MSTSHPDFAAAALRFFGRSAADLADPERRALKSAFQQRPISQNPADKTASFGDRLADRVASFGGSWTFIILFGLVLVAWTAGNALLRGHAFDPYPFISLNLMLSMLAAVQAPIIMMSQNRQAAKDRNDAEHDYEVNLKSEIEIMAVHDKLDDLRARDIAGLIERQQKLIDRQQKQIDRLTRVLEKLAP